MIGHLRSQNIFLPRTRVRASIHRTDPEGTAARRSVTVRRRVYHADGPNYVFIKYRFVVHGAMDGYSRLITYLNCNNNRAVTVLSCFSQAVQEHGLPTHIRSDGWGKCRCLEVHGVAALQYMLCHNWNIYS